MITPLEQARSHESEPAAELPGVQLRGPKGGNRRDLVNDRQKSTSILNEAKGAELVPRC